MNNNEAAKASATLSLSTGVFGPEPFVRELQWCRRLGLKSIEINPRHAEQLHGCRDMRREALETMERLGIRLGSLHAWTEVEGLAEVCPTARELRAGLIVVHCGPDRLEADFDASVEAARRWHDWGVDHGITLTIENASRQQFEPFVRFFQAVPELSATLDIRHAYKPQLFGRTHRDYLRALAGRIANWHLAGIDPTRKPAVGDGTPPGNDVIDWDELAGDLAALKYKGLLTIETTLPAGLSPEQRDQAYADIPPVSPEETTVSRRLSRYAVEFFRERFSRLLGCGAGGSRGARGASPRSRWAGGRAWGRTRREAGACVGGAWGVESGLATASPWQAGADASLRA